MSKNADNLDKSIIYRLLNVSYYFVFLISLFFISILGSDFKPTPKTLQPVKMTREEYSQKYGINEYQKIAGTKTERLSYEDLGARAKIKYQEYSNLTDFEAGKAVIAKYPIYQNVINSSTTDNKTWVKYITFIIIGIISISITLQIVWESLIYIIFGKKHVWNRFKRVITKKN